MFRGLGCIGLLLGLAFIAGLLVTSSPQLAGVLGLYTYVIVKGATDGIIGRPMFAKLISFEDHPVDKSGDIGPAVVEYEDGRSTKTASIALLPRPLRPYSIGDPIPVLVDRLNGKRATYDAMWANRPEHQARLAPIREMMARNSHRQNR